MTDIEPTFQEEECWYTFAPCKECPFKVCWREHKQRALSAARKEVAWILFGKRWKPRTIAMTQSVKTETVRQWIREMMEKE